MATEALQIDALWSGLNDPLNGKSYSGAIVATFASGTSTPKAVWTDKEKTLPAAIGQSQFTLDSNGQAFVFGDGKYKINVYAPTDTGLTSPLMTIDGATYQLPSSVSGISLSSIYECDLASAIAGIGTTETTLIVDCDSIIASGTTVTTPSTLSLNIIKGGSIDGVAGGATETLTINGPLIAGPYQIFGSNLTVSGTPLIDKIHPDWWETNTTPGTTVMATAIQSAINLSVANARTPISFIGNTEYYLGTTSLTIPVNGIYFKGNGAVISYAGADTFIKTGTAGSTRFDMIIENTVFDTDVAAGGLSAVLDLRGMSRFRVRDCRLRTNGNDGIWIGTSSVGDGSIENFIEKNQINMEIQGSGNGIYNEDDVNTTLTIRGNILNFGDNSIVLSNSTGTSASTLIDGNVMELMNIGIKVPRDAVKNLSVTNNYAENFEVAFIQSASPFNWMNNRISSPGDNALVIDVNTYLPDIRITNADEFDVSVYPIPNFPATNLAVNSDMSIWEAESGGDQLPTGYTVNAFSDVVWSRETTETFIGEAALKVVTAAGNKEFGQQITDTDIIASMKGRRIYLCVWVKASDADNVRLIIKDGVGSGVSINPAFHPGDDEWHYLVASRIVDTGATQIDFIVENVLAVGTYYVDSFTWSLGEPVSLYAVRSMND